MATKTKRKINYTDEPLGEIRVVDDFLPSPKELVFKEDNVKVTITLSKTSIEFFKKEAKKNHTQYQKMIRRLLDVYTEHHECKRRDCSWEASRTCWWRISPQPWRLVASSLFSPERRNRQF